MRREAGQGVVRLVDAIGTDSMIVHTRLGAANADRRILGEVRRFRRLGHRLEWKLYQHDEPADLHQRLLAQGFVADAAEAVMALLLGEPGPPDRPAAGVAVRVTEPRQLMDALLVYGQVWPAKRERLDARLRHTLQHDPGSISTYVLYAQGRPVATARTHFSRVSPFATLCGAVTLPEYRRRGYYRALLAERLEEARLRGARVATVDAGAMSEPILTKAGFSVLTRVQAHIHQLGRDPEAKP